MTKHSAVHSYHHLAEAETAVMRLIAQKFPANQISIITRNIETEKQIHGFISAGDVARGGAGTGTWVGGLFGLLVGAAFLWIPGVGPLIVAGPFAAALLGRVEGVAAGAASGGLLGALFGWGVSKEHILKYEEVVKGGDYLVIANGDEVQVKLARGLLDSLATDTIHPAKDEKVLQP